MIFIWWSFYIIEIWLVPFPEIVTILGCIRMQFLGSQTPNLIFATTGKGVATPNDGNILGGGFKYFLFSPLFGEMIQFD